MPTPAPIRRLCTFGPVRIAELDFHFMAKINEVPDGAEVNVGRLVPFVGHEV